MADITVKLPNLANQTAIVNALNKISQQTLDVRSLVASSIKENWKTIYPVGSIYISVSSASPASLFGGSWEQIKDGTLVSAGHTYYEWTHLCNENENFTLTSQTQVRYGRYNNFIYKTLSAGTYTANSSFFGSDPCPGAQKVVDIHKDYQISAGSKGGEVSHELSGEEIPFHNHPIFTKISATWKQPGYSKETWLMFPNNGTYSNEKSTGNGYLPTWTGYAFGSIDGTKPHNNMPPYLSVYMWKRVS